MSKHTPGPWAAFSDGNHTNIVAVKPATKCVFSLSGHHKNDPDVALIAAAPDMYGLLCDILTDFELGRIGVPYGFDVERIESVVAKAEGR
jgi:hypothetical protein